MTTVTSRASGQARKLRIVLALGALVSVTLTGCQTKVGAAAVVNGSKITPETVDSYVNLKLPGGDQQVDTIGARRTLALSFIIKNELIKKALARGGPLNQQEQAAEESARAGRADLAGQVAAAGFNDKLTDVVLAYQASATIFGKRAGFSDLAGLSAALSKQNDSVHVNPRYGDWSAQTAELDKFTPPPFLVPTPAPTPLPSQ